MIDLYGVVGLSRVRIDSLGQKGWRYKGEGYYRRELERISTHHVFLLAHIWMAYKLLSI
jgi:hypothetical protein